MPSRVFQRSLLTAHISLSVGWLGAVAAFLVLALAGLDDREQPMVGACYQAMDRIGWILIVPLCFGTLITGVVQSLTSEWGLLKYYWVVAKLGITIVSTVLLLVHMRFVAPVVDAALAHFQQDDMRDVRVRLVVDSGAALIALLAATALSVFKPFGRIRTQKPDSARTADVRSPIRTVVLKALLWIVAGLCLAAAVVMHLKHQNHR
jgi:hypothetical protein